MCFSLGVHRAYLPPPYWERWNALVSGGSVGLTSPPPYWFLWAANTFLQGSAGLTSPPPCWFLWSLFSPGVRDAYVAPAPCNHSIHLITTRSIVWHSQPFSFFHTVVSVAVHHSNSHTGQVIRACAALLAMDHMGIAGLALSPIRLASPPPFCKTSGQRYFSLRVRGAYLAPALLETLEC